MKHGEKVNCSNCKVFNNSIFQLLPKEELLNICSHNAHQGVKKGEFIFKETQHAYDFFCIEFGMVKLISNSDLGKESILKLYTAGDIFGFHPIVTNEPYRYSAIALEDTHLCSIPKKIFLEFIKKYPEFALSILKKISLELENSELKNVSLSQKSIKSRVAESIIFLKKRYGYDAESNTINVTFTRRELSEFVGTNIETIIRTITYLKSKKIIDFNKKKLIVLDDKKLELLAESRISI